MATKIQVGDMVRIGDKGVEDDFKGKEIRVYRDRSKVVRVPITTVDPEGRSHERVKTLRAGQFLFGTVYSVNEVQHEIREPVLKDGKPVLEPGGKRKTKLVKPAERTALVHLSGARYRTTILPVEMLVPASKSV